MTKRSTTPTGASANRDETPSSALDDTQSSIDVTIASSHASGERALSDDIETQAIHETQNSFTALNSTRSAEKRDRASGSAQGGDTLLSSSGIADQGYAEFEERLQLLEAEMGKLAARVRLLEKQEPPGSGLLHWVLALLLFVALAVSWRLVFAP